jgi:tetratricopeptide (TPR) repeat protein
VIGKRPERHGGSGSARQDFADRLGELFEAAGKPTLQQVVRATTDRMRAQRGPGRKETVTVQRISDWRAGRNVPGRFESVAPVLVTLFALVKARSVAVRADLVDPRAWERLWASALEEPGIGSGGGFASVPRPVVTAALRRDVATFIGRDHELQRVLQAVGPGRVVSIHTIDGMAGIGKTALATRAAHELKTGFPDGQYFVELHAHTPGQTPADPAEVLAGLLTDLGLDPRSIPDGLAARRDLWRDRLTGKQVLLVLDDARDHTQIEPLLPAGPECLTLVTSRRRLVALDEALPVALGILDPDSAAELFTTLAGRESYSDADHAAVAELVRWCGYLPLAIVLLAGRVAHHPAWSITGLAAEFAAAADRLTELDAGDRAVRAAFELSYRDLTPRQQRVFRRAGLHPGPDFDPYAAAALADIPVSVAWAELEALYTDHLLDETTPGRFQLHDLLRDYARTLAAADPAADNDRAVDRLLDHYQHTTAAADRYLASLIVPASRTPAPASAGAVRGFDDQMQALTWMRRERANLLACLEYAAGDRPARVVELTEVLAGSLERDGPWPQARHLYRRAAEAAVQSGDSLGQATALTRLGVIYQYTGEYSQAADLLRQALAIDEEIGYRVGEATTLGYLGLVRMYTGDYGQAADLYRQALAIFREIGNRFGEALTLTGLGFVRMWTGEYREAADLLRQALAIDEEIGYRFGEAFSRTGLGFVRMWVGDHDEAADLHRQALAISREIGYRFTEALALTGLGVVRMRAGDRDEAADLLWQALAMHRELGDRRGEAEALNEIGAVLLENGTPDDAETMFTAALDIARDIGCRREHARALDGLARCHAGREDTGTALRHLRDAVHLYRFLGAPETDSAATYLAALESHRPSP